MHPWHTDAKIVDRAGAAALRRLWREQGRRVVFTNGVFDILHPGHVELLEKARSFGDALIVALNTDASARRLGKGPGRPVNKLADRARVMAALACVDAVTGFGEDTPEELAGLLKPDVLVKGGDYKPDEVAGRSSAGKVVIVPLKRGHSTTGIVKKIGRK